MGKHDRERQEKDRKNRLLNARYRKGKCQGCGHRSSLLGRCKLCGGNIRPPRDN